MDGVNIDGVFVTPLKIIANPKGEILHGMKKSDVGYNEFGEAYFSTIHKGDIKAWKRHSLMTLNLMVPSGSVRFVLFDDRKNSLSFGKFDEVIISKENYSRLTIPPGVWMGFQGLDNQNMLLNIADIQHDPKEQENISIEESHINFNW